MHSVWGHAHKFKYSLTSSGQDNKPACVDAFNSKLKND